MTINTFDFLKSSIGETPLAYLLNLPLDSTHNMQEDQLSKNVTQHLSKLAKEIKQIEINRIKAGGLHSVSIFSFPGQYHYKYVHDTIRSLRGQVEEKNSSDPTLNYLFDCAYKYFISFLTSLNEKTHFPATMLFKTHKQWLNILKSCELSLLFDNIDAEDKLSISKNYNISTGSGGGIQAVQLDSVILQNAFNLISFRGCLELSSFYAAIEEIYLQTIQFAKYNECEVSRFVGLHNFCIDESKISEHFLIHPIKRAILKKLYVSPSQRPDKNNQLFFTDSILEVKVKIKNYQKRDDLYTKEISLWSQNIHSAQEEILLSVILADKNLSSVHMPWATTINPIGFSGTSFSSSQKISNSFYDARKEENYLLFSKYHKAILDKPINNIKIAISRLLKALTDRTDPTDSFIDIMIGLENIFGTDRETTSHLSNTIAKILEHELVQRKSLVKKIKNVYGNRSRLIHGSKHFKFEAIIKDRDFSLDILKKCIIHLIEKEPELLPLKSAERVQAVLLR